MRRKRLTDISNAKKEQKIELFIMGFPFLVLMLVFSYGPLFGWIYAFFDYKPGIPVFQAKFEGIKHFIEIFAGNDEMVTVLRNTIVLSMLGILITPIPIFIAIMLSEIKNKTFKKFVQTTTTLPNFISWVLVYAVFFAFFSSQGFINTLLSNLGLEGNLDVLGNVDIAWYVQTAISLWKTAGWSSIIYLAAISGIDSELFDAAKVDGSGRFGLIKNITIPGILPTYVVLLLLAVSNMLSNGFDQYFVFYSPLTADKIQVLDYYVYRMGIFLNDYPLATAVGILKTIVSVIILFTTNGIVKKIKGEGIV